ncbi:MAG: hypothetical protein M3N51_04565 [Actinomycetota bacterium]|nr:hypothetical protein [Actinomycetota bacterium]
MRPTATLLLVLAVLGAGCAPEAGEPRTGQPSQTTTSSTVTRPTREERPVESVPPTGERVTGEVPDDLLQEMRADLVERTGADLAAIRVVTAEQVVWNDGSLGCPQPGEFYTQGLVDGYQVVLEVDGAEYDYRASDQGFFFLCEPALPLEP